MHLPESNFSLYSEKNIAWLNHLVKTCKENIKRNNDGIEKDRKELSNLQDRIEEINDSLHKEEEDSRIRAARFGSSLSHREFEEMWAEKHAEAKQKTMALKKQQTPYRKSIARKTLAIFDNEERIRMANKWLDEYKSLGYIKD